MALLLNRQETLNEGQRRAENLALILDDHLVRTVNAIDITLSQLALHHARAAASGNSREVWGQVFEATRSATAGVAALSILDENGIVVFSTVPALIGQSARGHEHLPPPLHRGGPRPRGRPAGARASERPIRHSLRPQAARRGRPLRRRAGRDARTRTLARFLPHDRRRQERLHLGDAPALGRCCFASRGRPTSPRPRR